MYIYYSVNRSRAVLSIPDDRIWKIATMKGFNEAGSLSAVSIGLEIEGQERICVAAPDPDEFPYGDLELEDLEVLYDGVVSMISELVTDEDYDGSIRIPDLVSSVYLSLFRDVEDEDFDDEAFDEELDEEEDEPLDAFAAWGDEPTVEMPGHGVFPLDLDDDAFEETVIPDIDHDAPLSEKRLWDIGDLEISVRTYAVLSKNHIKTIGQLLATPTDRIRSMQSFSRRCWEDLTRRLYDEGFRRFDDGTEIGVEE